MSVPIEIQNLILENKKECDEFNKASDLFKDQKHLRVIKIAEEIGKHIINSGLLTDLKWSSMKAARSDRFILYVKIKDALVLHNLFKDLDKIDPDIDFLTGGIYIPLEKNNIKIFLRIINDRFIYRPAAYFRLDFNKKILIEDVIKAFDLKQSEKDRKEEVKRLKKRKGWNIIVR